MKTMTTIMPTEIRIFSQKHPRRNHKNDRISSRTRSSISNKTTITKRSRTLKKGIHKCMSQSKCGKKYQTYCQQKTAAAELESSRRTTERDDTTVATELIADLIDDLELPRQNNKTKKPDNKNDGDKIVIVSTLVAQTVKRTALHTYRALNY